MEYRSPLLIVLAIVLLIAVTIVVFFLVRSAPDKALSQRGIAAQAKVLELAKTGVNRGPNTPLVHLRLEISSPQHAPYVVEIEQGIHVMDLPRYQEGAIVEVRVDPKTPAVVALVP